MIGYFTIGTKYALGDGYFYVTLGFLLCFGALCGDMVASFFKRRAGVKRGKSVPLVDQLDFIVGALLLSSVVYVPLWEVVVIVLVATPVIHLFLNYVGHRLKCKPVPW